MGKGVVEGTIAVTLHGLPYGFPFSQQARKVVGVMYIDINFENWLSAVWEREPELETGPKINTQLPDIGF